MDEPTGTSPYLGFDAAYRGLAAPWDLGRPQPALLALARSGVLAGPVLDVGCGTGEHALMAAELGLQATGIDASPTAISIAERKAAERGFGVRFSVADALDLAALGRTFGTVIDSGLFHGFGEPDRARYAKGLHAILVPGGHFVLLAFSDRESGMGSSLGLSEAEIRAAFADGWTIEAIEPARIETNIAGRSIKAWLAMISRI
jgi:cyclopropane fatty-acyl-phospholipid synthase-like methyltransferase